MAFYPIRLQNLGMVVWRFLPYALVFGLGFVIGMFYLDWKIFQQVFYKR